MATRLQSPPRTASGPAVVFVMGGTGIPSSHNIKWRTARKCIDWMEDASDVELTGMSELVDGMKKLSKRRKCPQAPFAMCQQYPT